MGFIFCSPILHDKYIYWVTPKLTRDEIESPQVYMELDLFSSPMFPPE